MKGPSLSSPLAPPAERILILCITVTIVMAAINVASSTTKMKPAPGIRISVCGWAVITSGYLIYNHITTVFEAE
jgi:hypothetical protein